jgi:hypothetical protein
MPIIINELEILPEPSSEHGPSQTTPGPEEEAPTIPEPPAILGVERRYAQRRRRLWAD